MSLIRIDWNPDRRKLRQFGVGLVLFGLVLLGAAGLKGRASTSGLRALGLFSALGAATLAFPSAGRWIYKAWMGVAFVIGTVVSTLLLAFLYFGIITPMGIAMRLAGRDPLLLKKRVADSYWNILELPEDPAYYERLF